MLKKIGQFLTALYYFLPVQLLVHQLRAHKVFLLLWVFLFLAVGGNFGEMFGIPYLFLEPEYLGEVGYLSMLLLGVGLGAFISTYHIATYISDSDLFFFIAIEHRPFRTYFLNNNFLPAVFLINYSIQFLKFETYLRGGFEWELLGMLGCFVVGMASVIAMVLIYFGRTTRTAGKAFGVEVMRAVKSRRLIIGKARKASSHQHRVDSFLNAHFQIEKTIPTLQVDFRKMVKLLNQHHGNALFFSFLLILFVVSSGFLEGVKWFQVPAGMSILLFCAIAVMIIAALNFWFKKLGPLVLLVLLAIYFVIDQPDLMRNRHQALGMSYDVPAAPYTLDRMRAISSPEIIEQDRRHTLSILERWKSDYALFHPPQQKPRAILICTSGGGQRASYFTFRAMQVLDSLTNGDFFQNTRFICGASGGMIGAAYYRELSLREAKQQLPSEKPLHDFAYSRNVSNDLLNRITFKMVNGLFLPGMHERIGDQRYVSDRGVSFDLQVMENMPELRDIRLSDYSEPEYQALVPMMILSPVILNDGRKLFISSSPVSYLTRGGGDIGGQDYGVTGVEFRRMFDAQEADSLLFVTALRMSATFPYISPYIQLPSDPPTKLIDAGIADNFGTQVAATFIDQFGDWLRENTGGVLVLQIRDSESQSLALPRYQQSNLLDQVLDPLGSAYSSFIDSHDHLNEDYLEFSESRLGDLFHYARLEYAPVDSSGMRASLSWHLTSKEKQDIEASLGSAANRLGMKTVMDFLLTQDSELDSVAVGR